MPYRCLERTLNTALKDAAIIYVKGEEKIKWINEKINRRISIVDLQQMGCPAIKVLQENETKCNNHKVHLTPVCAAKNIQLLKNWLLNHRRVYGTGLDEVDEF